MTAPALLDQKVDLPKHPHFNLFAIDTETELIRLPEFDARRKTCLRPQDVPDLILGSIASSGQVSVLRAPALCQAVREILESGAHVVFHNAPFDVFVLGRADPTLWHLLFQAGDENRLHDTQVLELLIQIARGVDVYTKKVLKSESLATLAKRRCGISLDKESGVRVTFGQYRSPDSVIPQNYLEYAALDAEATYRVYINQYREAELYAEPKSSLPVLPGARARFGLLSESIHVKGAIGLRWMGMFPLRVDLDRCQARRDKLRAEAARLEDALVLYGFAKRSVKARKFSLQQKRLRGILAEYSKFHAIVPEYSNSGLLSLTYDFWAERLPRLSQERLDGDLSAISGLEDRLCVWLRYCRVRKLLSTYLDVYAAGPEHYPTYWNLGSRTGRVSCSRPNCQNIPKRRDGIRALFVPAPGRRLLESDYKAAELAALAQVYHLSYGGSLLEEAINSGRDPHIELARRLIGDSEWETATPEERKKYRQGAKACNFGFPGGLGATKFATYAHKTYGLTLSESQAKELRAKAFDAEPALRTYLSDSRSPEAMLRLAAANLGMSFNALITHLRAWRDEESGAIHWHAAAKRLRAWARGDAQFQIPVPPGFKPQTDLFKTPAISPVGFVRGRASYTESHNLPFQNLVASGAKLALWNLMREHTSDPSFWQPAAFIHDSILIEAQEGREQEARQRLESSMIAGLKAVCPDITIGVDTTEPLTRWGINTDADGKELKE